MPLLFLLMMMMLTLTSADNPALKALLSQKGLTDASQMMPVLIQSKLKSVVIPDVSGAVKIKIGTIHYTLSNLRVVQCSLPGLTLALVRGTGVSVDVAQLSLVVSGRWATKFGAIHDHGSFELMVNNMKMDSVLQMGDTAGLLSISVSSCNGGLGGVDIHFHGGGSFFFDMFKKKIRGIISDKIRGEICPSVRKAVNELDTKLQKKSVNIPMDQYIFLKAALTSAPIVTEQSFELDFKGEFYSRRSPSEPPFSARAFDVQCSENHMLSLAASEFSVNSAAYAYLRSGVLQINVNDSMIPKSSPIRLNTTQFSAFVPQLRTLYPNMKMEVLLYAGETPLFSFSSGLINLQVKTGAKFSAVKPDGSLAPLFRLDVDGNFSGNAQIHNAYLTGQSKMNNLTLTLGSSEIGDFKTDALESILKFAMKTIVFPELNVYLKKGFLIPKLQGFSLTNSQLLIKNGFVAIFTDVKDSLKG